MPRPYPQYKQQYVKISSQSINQIQQQIKQNNIINTISAIINIVLKNELNKKPIG